MADLLSIRGGTMKGIINRIGQAKEVCRKPFAQTRSSQTITLFRTGVKGIAQQFADQTEYRGTSSIPWTRKHAFGTKTARGKTMLGSGLYRAAWLGGGGGTVTTTDNIISVGVDKSVFPQVKIHQGSTGSVTIFPHKKITRKLKSGRVSTQWAMRFALGMEYGAWMTNERVGRGFKIARRRISVSADVRRAVAALVKSAIRSKLRGVATQAVKR